MNTYNIASILSINPSRRQLMNEVRSIANELISRSERAKRLPWSAGQVWAMDIQASTQYLALAAMAYACILDNPPH